MKRLGLMVGLGLALVACGGSNPEAAAPDSSAAAEKSEASESDASEPVAESAKSDEGRAAPSGVPTSCANKGGGTCLPSKAFVQKLCADSYPGVALYLFANSSPWTRVYLRGKTKAWNASGGASDNSSFLEFDEEVIVLVERKADLGGMQVSGAGASYDALRWDGSCVTLSSEEVSLDKPPSPKSAKVEWRFLDDNVQEALRQDSKVNDAYLARRKECGGASSGEVSMKCVKADQKLSDVIVGHLRGGGKLPVPSKVP
ncbi:MAG TPA: hypothetical protein VFZ53_22365 [Polyangiaceae bacterium]